MRKAILAAAVLVGFASTPAEAKPGGCLKYGAGGAIAGKLAGGHTWKGAALGCVLGIYQRRQYERSQAARRDRTFERREADNRERPYGRGGSSDRREADYRERPSRRDGSYERRRFPEDDTTGSIDGFGRGGAFSRDPRF